MMDEAIREFYKKAKVGDTLNVKDSQGNDLVYTMKPGTYMNVAGQEEDPFVQIYLNSIDYSGQGRKFYPQRVK